MFIGFGKILVISVIVTFLFSFWVLANTVINLSPIKTVKAEHKVSIVKGAVNLGDEAYKPNPIALSMGDTITWINNDNVIHTSTSSSNNSDTPGTKFDSGLIRPGEIFNFTLSKEEVKNIHNNTINYFCKVHPTMVGKIALS